MSPVEASVRFALSLLFLAALGVWLGEIVFFSFVVAPSLFRALPVEVAGEVVAAIFPRYYDIGLGAGAVLIGTAFALGMRSPSRAGWLAMAVLAAMMFGMTLYAGAVVQPRAETLRLQLHAGSVPSLEAQAEFELLHRRAVQLNGLTLALGLGVLGVTARMLRG